MGGRTVAGGRAQSAVGVIIGLVARGDISTVDHFDVAGALASPEDPIVRDGSDRAILVFHGPREIVASGRLVM